jgi:hypothetical protein
MQKLRRFDHDCTNLSRCRQGLGDPPALSVLAIYQLVEHGSEPVQALQVRLGQALQDLVPRTRQADPDDPPVVGVWLAVDQAGGLSTVDEFHRAVRAQQHVLGQVADGGGLRSGMPLDGDQELMLNMSEAGLTGLVLAPALELAQRDTELEQLLEVRAPGLSHLRRLSSPDTIARPVRSGNRRTCTIGITSHSRQNRWQRAEWRYGFGMERTGERPGGVVITALAAYLGPLRLQRRKAEADLALQVRKEEADKAAAVEAAVRERRAAEADSLNKLISKIIEVRVSTALALETYKAVIRDLGNGHPVDWDVFSNEARNRAERVHEAAAGLLASGVKMSSGGYGDTHPSRPPALSAEPPSPETSFLDCLDSVSRLIAQIRAGQPATPGPLDDALTSALEARLQRAAAARRDILDSLQELGESRHGIRFVTPRTGA